MTRLKPYWTDQAIRQMKEIFDCRQNPSNLNKMLKL